MPRRPRILLVNASLAGAAGNTAVLLTRIQRALRGKAAAETAVLAGGPDFAALRPRLAAADGFVFGTGTHWDGWSSELQRFLEAATAAEATSLWLGKPAAVVVSEHSTGGKGVLSRLQGVLVTLGCSVPPLGGMVVSRAALLAAKSDRSAARDFWGLADLGVVAHNVAEAARISLPGARAATPRWRTWPVDRRDFAARWLDVPARSAQPPPE